ncbi:MAG: fasciclin domain-containing protein [Planctomycetes bacterium]|nr:fasciclin domain-containing protein [Planctomycetota bacterium]
MLQSKFLVVAACAAALSSPSTCFATAQHGDEKNTNEKNLVEVAAAAGSFQTLLKAAKAAGLVETLTGKGPLTVFAPSDDAFAKLPKGTIEALLADKEKLASILTYHVVPGRVLSKDLPAASWASTAQGQSLRIVKADNGVSVDDAHVVNADILASNGVIHVIDKVVLPRKNLVEVASGAKAFQTLLAAAKAAGLAETLAMKGPFTVFAPSDDAFAKLPEGTVEALLADKEKLANILLYHVVPGRLAASDVLTKTWLDTAEGAALYVNMREGKPSVDDARIVKTDVFAGNGVIHVVDSVILPRKSIVETAVAAGGFETLVAAVKAAGLVDALSGKGPFTVFAPSDDAFAKLPEGKLEALLADPKMLAGILKYHVVPGRVLAKDVPLRGADARPIEVASLQGESLKILRTEGGVQVNGASVVSKDIVTRNGIIHVLDSVVLPPSLTEGKGD